MNLEQRLSENLNLTDPSTAKALTFGINDAIEYQKRLQDIHAHGVTLKEFREALTRLHNALAKLARGTAGTATNTANVKHYLAMIPADYMGLFDTVNREFYFSEPWHPDSSRFEGIAVALKDMSDNERKPQAERLRAIVELVLTDINKPGQGAARMQAKRYSMGIQCLMRHFRDALPSNPITAKPGSVFYRYVLIWMEQAGFSTDEKPTPNRHIQNAIADMENWEKLSL